MDRGSGFAPQSRELSFHQRRGNSLCIHPTEHVGEPASGDSPRFARMVAIMHAPVGACFLVKARCMGALVPDFLLCSCLLCRPVGSSGRSPRDESFGRLTGLDWPGTHTETRGQLAVPWHHPACVTWIGVATLDYVNIRLHWRFASTGESCVCVCVRVCARMRARVCVRARARARLCVCVFWIYIASLFIQLHSAELKGGCFSRRLTCSY